MTNPARRAYRFVSGRLSHRQKRSIKVVGKRLLPRRSHQYLGHTFRRLRGNIGDDGRPPSHRTKHERVLNRNITSLSRALWLGFTDDAVAELERIRRGPDAHRAPVARATETLARWYATDQRYDVALERLVQARILNGRRHTDRLRVLEHHLLTQLGHFDEADQLFQTWGAQSPDLYLVQANLRLRQAAAGLLPREDADRERLELIDWVFHAHSLIPVGRLVGAASTLEFASLQTEPVWAREVRDPVVTIVVPAYNAEDTLTTSVNSMRAQTLTDLEIVIVDDASTDNTYAVAKSLATDDPRVRVIQHEQNRGAYGARNTGLANATGEYFTVHDADDWSHPQLLERQLRILRERDARGSFSRLARVSRDLEFQLRTYRPMLEPIHWNYTSLLSTTETFRELGGWDTVRAHADSELIERVREYYGKDSLVETDTQVPLSFFLVTGGNLTEAKGTGLRSVDFGARKEYTEQSRYWRRQAFPDGQTPSYEKYRRTDSKSPFFCPRPLAGDRDQISPAYDLVIGSDLSLLGGTRRCNLAYIDCARRLGLRVGLFNAPRYRMRGFGTIDDSYRELFQFDDVDLITPEDNVSAQALLVHHPPVLRHAFNGYPTIDAAAHYLLVNQLPWQTKDLSDVQYDTSTVHRRFTEAFGGEPTWISISPRVRRHLEMAVSTDAILDDDWFPIVSWADTSPPIRTVRRGTTPVIGRQSRDHATKWPEDARTLAQCYLADTEFEVRLLGGTEAAENVLGYRPANWVVYPFDSLPVEEFVRGIDIFIHFHHSNYIEEFGRNIAEAMAMGVPCVLPTEYAEIFGAAAVYAEPDRVARTVRDLWADGDRYSEYSRRGAAFVFEHCGSEVGMRRVARLLR